MNSRVLRWVIVLVLGSVQPCALVFAQEPGASDKRLTEPVYKVADNADSATITPSTSAEPTPLAPIDQALQIAEEGQQRIRNTISDYTAVLVKRERINGRLGEPQYISLKIRNRRETESGIIPFSIYMRFLKPADVCGRECIWVEGRNNNKIIAHDTGIRGLVTAHLDPNGSLAMEDNRYPIYDAGIENLVTKLIEKARREKEWGTCQVEFLPGSKIQDRACTIIQVTHPDRKPEYEFHMAQIFMDDELQVPVRYAAFSWPATEGGKPVLEEEYTYIKLNLNVGLSDRDFDHTNPNYEYRR